jgi:hypothetical protein
VGFIVGYLGHHEDCSYYPSHGYPEPSLWAESFASAWYPDWYAPLQWYISFVVDQAERVVKGIERLERRMNDLSDKWRCKLPSTHIPAWCTTSSVTSGLTLMLKSCKDLSLGEVLGAQICVRTCLVSFLAFLVISSLFLPIVSLPLSWLLVSIASLS